MAERNDQEWKHVESFIREAIPERNRHGKQWKAFWSQEAPSLYQKLTHDPFGFQWTYQGVTLTGVPREQLFVVRQAQRVPTLHYPIIVQLSSEIQWPPSMRDTLLHRMWILPVQRHEKINETCYLMEGNNVHWLFQLIVALCVKNGHQDPLCAIKKQDP